MKKYILSLFVLSITHVSYGQNAALEQQVTELVNLINHVPEPYKTTVIKNALNISILRTTRDPMDTKTKDALFHDTIKPLASVVKVIFDKITKIYNENGIAAIIKLRDSLQ